MVNRFQYACIATHAGIGTELIATGIVEGDDNARLQIERHAFEWAKRVNKRRPGDEVSAYTAGRLAAAGCVLKLGDHLFVAAMTEVGP